MNKNSKTKNLSKNSSTVSITNLKLRSKQKTIHQPIIKKEEDSPKPDTIGDDIKLSEPQTSYFDINCKKQQQMLDEMRSVLKKKAEVKRGPSMLKEFQKIYKKAWDKNGDYTITVDEPETKSDDDLFYPEIRNQGWFLLENTNHEPLRSSCDEQVQLDFLMGRVAVTQVNAAIDKGKQKSDRKIAYALKLNLFRLAAMVNSVEERDKLLKNFIIYQFSFRFGFAEKTEQCRNMTTILGILQEQYEQYIAPHFKGRMSKWPSKYTSKYLLQHVRCLPLTSDEWDQVMKDPRCDKSSFWFIKYANFEFRQRNNLKQFPLRQHNKILATGPAKSKRKFEAKHNVNQKTPFPKTQKLKKKIEIEQSSDEASVQETPESAFSQLLQNKKRTKKHLSQSDYILSSSTPNTSSQVTQKKNKKQKIKDASKSISQLLAQGQDTQIELSAEKSRESQQTSEKNLTQYEAVTTKYDCEITIESQSIQSAPQLIQRPSIIEEINKIKEIGSSPKYSQTRFEKEMSKDEIKQQIVVNEIIEPVINLKENSMHCFARNQSAMDDIRKQQAILHEFEKEIDMVAKNMIIQGPLLLKETPYLKLFKILVCGSVVADGTNIATRYQNIKLNRLIDTHPFIPPYKNTGMLIPNHKYQLQFRDWLCEDRMELLEPHIPKHNQRVSVIAKIEEMACDLIHNHEKRRTTQTQFLQVAEEKEYFGEFTRYFKMIWKNKYMFCKDCCFVNSNNHRCVDLLKTKIMNKSLNVFPGSDKEGWVCPHKECFGIVWPTQQYAAFHYVYIHGKATEEEQLLFLQAGLNKLSLCQILKWSQGITPLIEDMLSSLNYHLYYVFKKGELRFWAGQLETPVHDIPENHQFPKHKVRNFVYRNIAVNNDKEGIHLQKIEGHQSLVLRKETYDNSEKTRQLYKMCVHQARKSLHSHKGTTVQPKCQNTYQTENHYVCQFVASGETLLESMFVESDPELMKIQKGCRPKTSHALFAVYDQVKVLGQQCCIDEQTQGYFCQANFKLAIAADGITKFPRITGADWEKTGLNHRNVLNNMAFCEESKSYESNALGYFGRLVVSQYLSGGKTWFLINLRVGQWYFNSTPFVNYGHSTDYDRVENIFKSCKKKHLIVTEFFKVCVKYKESIFLGKSMDLECYNQIFASFPFTREDGFHPNQLDDQPCIDSSTFHSMPSVDIQVKGKRSHYSKQDIDLIEKTQLTLVSDALRLGILKKGMLLIPLEDNHKLLKQMIKQAKIKHYEPLNHAAIVVLILQTVNDFTHKLEGFQSPATLIEEISKIVINNFEVHALHNFEDPGQTHKWYVQCLEKSSLYGIDYNQDLMELWKDKIDSKLMDRNQKAADSKTKKNHQVSFTGNEMVFSENRCNFLKTRPEQEYQTIMLGVVKCDATRIGNVQQVEYKEPMRLNDILNKPETYIHEVDDKTMKEKIDEMTMNFHNETEFKRMWQCLKDIGLVTQSNMSQTEFQDSDNPDLKWKIIQFLIHISQTGRCDLITWVKRLNRYSMEGFCVGEKLRHKIEMIKYELSAGVLDYLQNVLLIDMDWPHFLYATVKFVMKNTKATTPFYKNKIHHLMKVYKIENCSVSDSIWLEGDISMFCKSVNKKGEIDSHNFETDASYGLIPNVKSFNTMVVVFDSPQKIKCYLLQLPFSVLGQDVEPVYMTIYFEAKPNTNRYWMSWVVMNSQTTNENGDFCNIQMNIATASDTDVGPNLKLVNIIDTTQDNFAEMIIQKNNVQTFMLYQLFIFMHLNLHLQDPVSDDLRSPIQQHQIFHCLKKAYYCSELDLGFPMINHADDKSILKQVYDNANRTNANFCPGHTYDYKDDDLDKISTILQIYKFDQMTITNAMDAKFKVPILPVTRDSIPNESSPLVFKKIDKTGALLEDPIV